MEEAKAAAYYDELTRKGEGAARFKQGLGFSSSSAADSFPPKTSSLFSNFVRASSPGKAAELQKQAQLETVQNKLRRHSDRRDDAPDRRDDRRSGGSRRRSSSRERRSEIDSGRSSHRHGSQGGGGRETHGERRRRRSRSTSREEEEEEGGGYRRGKDRDRESPHRRSRRSRSRNPSRELRSGERGRDRKREKGSPQHRSSKSKSANVDYSLLIEGYSQMTPAERIKAKMKVQLSQTAAKDTSMGMNTGWERFDFNKDAPLDDDDEIEVAEDDASLVKVIGKSFRFSAAEAKHEEEVKAAHDQAMFGTPAALSALPEIASTQDSDATDLNEKNPSDVLISDRVFVMQQGSWRDRARRFQNSSGS